MLVQIPQPLGSEVIGLSCPNLFHLLQVGHVSDSMAIHLLQGSFNSVSPLELELSDTLIQPSVNFIFSQFIFLQLALL